jgi:hypothetical protein
VAFTQFLVRASGSTFREMSVTTAALSAPASRTPATRASVIPPIPTRGMLPIFFFHSVMRGRPCGAKAMAFRDRRIDWPKRDIIRAYIERAEKLGFVMRRDAEFYPRAAERRRSRDAHFCRCDRGRRAKPPIREGVRRLLYRHVPGDDKELRR